MASLRGELRLEEDGPRRKRHAAMRRRWRWCTGIHCPNSAGWQLGGALRRGRGRRNQALRDRVAAVALVPPLASRSTLDPQHCVTAIKASSRGSLQRRALLGVAQHGSLSPEIATPAVQVRSSPC